jgi:hypothetical protein
LAAYAASFLLPARAIVCHCVGASGAKDNIGLWKFHK